jgi:hypothetical protein
MKKAIYFRKFYYLVLILVVSTFFACKPAKTTYTADLQLFITKVEKDYPNYTDKDWEKTTLEYEKLSNIRYQEIESSLNTEEKKEISDLLDRYRACLVKASLKDIKNGIKSGLERASKFIENIITDTSIIKR